MHGPTVWSRLRIVDIKLFADNGFGVDDDDERTTTSPHVKHIHGDRVSSRAYLYGATLDKSIENHFIYIYIYPWDTWFIRSIYSLGKGYNWLTNMGYLIDDLLVDKFNNQLLIRSFSVSSNFDKHIGKPR